MTVGTWMSRAGKCAGSRLRAVVVRDASAEHGPGPRTVEVSTADGNEVGKPGQGSQRSKGGRCSCKLQEGTMDDASTSMNMSLLKVVERAKREPEGRFHSLAHLIDVPALERAYDRMRKDLTE
jgi:hypothetical protein